MTAPQKQNQWDEYLLSPPVPDLGPGATTDRICPGSGKRQTLKPSRVWKRMPFIEMKEYRGQSERDEEEARSFILGGGRDSPFVIHTVTDKNVQDT